MKNAGSEGFLSLMPVYLEHILYPTLTDAGFTTEVHHVNGDGEDAGVVYCEMQARENTAEELTLFRLLQAMYPGDCGYKSDTGGRLHNLRTSCSNERVKAYHKHYYRPDNLALIITGQLEPDDVFTALAPFEEKVMSKGPLPSMERPWQSPVPPLLSSVCEVVAFPSDDEKDGMAVMAWRGPKAGDRYFYSAIVALVEYLHSTSVAPLQIGLVHVDEPYCSEMELLLQENAEVCIGLEFHGVPTQKLPQIKDKKDRNWKEAIRTNEIPPPMDIVTSFPVPGINSIRFHELVVHGNHGTEDATLSLKLPVGHLPFFFEVHQIHSSLVKLTAALNTSAVPVALRPYIPLLLELYFDSPVQRNGVGVPHDIRVREIAEETVSTSATLGQKGKKFEFGVFPEIAFVTVKVEPQQYIKGVQHLQEAMYGLQFTRDRLTIVVNKLLNYITKVKRMGNQAVRMVHSSMVFRAESMYNYCSAITQEKFLGDILACLKDTTASEKVIEDMRTVQSALVSPSNIRVFVAMNIHSLPHMKPSAPWLHFVPSSYLEGPRSVQPPSVSLSVALMQEMSCGRGFLAGLGSVESSYLIQSVPCIKTPVHHDFASILVLMEYLGALEGPMWRQIRGMGLSYGYRLECKPEDGLLYFMLLKASHVVQGYEAAKNIVDDFVKGVTPINSGQLEAAISGAVFFIIDLEQSMNDLADQAILNSLKGLDATFSQ
eukprot:Em0016g1132a